MGRIWVGITFVSNNPGLWNTMIENCLSFDNQSDLDAKMFTSASKE